MNSNLHNHSTRSTQHFIKRAELYKSIKKNENLFAFQYAWLKFWNWWLSPIKIAITAPVITSKEDIMVTMSRSWQIRGWTNNEIMIQIEWYMIYFSDSHLRNICKCNVLFPSFTLGSVIIHTTGNLFKLQINSSELKMFWWSFTPYILSNKKKSHRIYKYQASKTQKIFIRFTSIRNQDPQKQWKLAPSTLNLRIRID